MAGYSDAAKILMLNAIGASAVYASLHTADPGITGASEVATGVYARKSITWNTATVSSGTGDLDNNLNPVFDVPAGTTVTHWGLWSASSAGTFYVSGALSASEVFGSQGQYTLTDLDLLLTG